MGRRKELLNLCQHPAPEEMGSSLEQEVSETLQMAVALCLGLLGSCPPSLPASRATMSLLLPQQERCL